MKTPTFVFPLFAALATVWAGPASDDTKSIQGSWVPVQAELSGAPMPEAVVKSILLKISKDEYEVTVQGQAGTDRGTITLDTSLKPRAMKITGVQGPNAGKTFPAIYELDGDTLRICYDLSGTQRPKEFKTSKGTKLYLVTYSRKKE